MPKCTLIVFARRNAFDTIGYKELKGKSTANLLIHPSASEGIYGGMNIPLAIAINSYFSQSVGTHRGLVMARCLTASEALHRVLERETIAPTRSQA